MSAPNPSAFPIPDVRTHDGFGISEGSPGMTLRDWLAGQVAPAIVAAVSAGQHSKKPDRTAVQTIAEDAYALADAMLDARALATGETPR